MKTVDIEALEKRWRTALYAGEKSKAARLEAQIVEQRALGVKHERRT